MRPAQGHGTVGVAAGAIELDRRAVEDSLVGPRVSPRLEGGVGAEAGDLDERAAGHGGSLIVCHGQHDVEVPAVGERVLDRRLAAVDRGVVAEVPGPFRDDAVGVGGLVLQLDDAFGLRDRVKTADGEDASVDVDGAALGGRIRIVVVLRQRDRVVRWPREIDVARVRDGVRDGGCLAEVPQARQGRANLGRRQVREGDGLALADEEGCRLEVHDGEGEGEAVVAHGEVAPRVSCAGRAVRVLQAKTGDRCQRATALDAGRDQVAARVGDRLVVDLGPVEALEDFVLVAEKRPAAAAVEVLVIHLDDEDAGPRRAEGLVVHGATVEAVEVGPVGGQEVAGPTRARNRHAGAAPCAAAGWETDEAVRTHAGCGGRDCVVRVAEADGDPACCGVVAEAARDGSPGGTDVDPVVGGTAGLGRVLEAVAGAVRTAG